MHPWRKSFSGLFHCLRKPDSKAPFHAVHHKGQGKYDEQVQSGNDVIEPSPFRQNPVCEHFNICGGCKWQNYEYNMQLKYKQEQLRQHLIRIAGIDNPPVEPIIAARKTYFYRNKMEFSFHQDKNGEPLLGLHRRGQYDRVFNLSRCHLQSERSNRIVNMVFDGGQLQGWFRAVA